MKNVFALLTLLALVGCNRSTMTSPSGGFDASADLAPTSSVPSGNGDNVAPVSADVPQTQCELINITARRVLNVQPGSVTLRVTASPNGSVQNLYVRITRRDTGVSFGDYPLGDITLKPLEAGDYDLRIFVEGTFNGQIIQCDGGLTFTIPKLPPPPPPQCTGEPYYVIDVEAWTEEIETCVPQEPLPGKPVCTDNPDTYEFKEHRHTSSDIWNNAYKNLCETTLGGVWVEQFYHSTGDKCTFVGSPSESFTVNNPFAPFSYTDPWFQLKNTIDGGETCVPGEPIPQPDACTIEYVEHPEEGHLVDPCDEGQEQ